MRYDAPKVMGILNLTPDSFSDRVRHSGGDAVRRMFEMEDEGADIIDVGGESTRPYASPVSPEEEMSRIIGVIKEAAPSLGIPISADTMHAETAVAAIDAGAAMINDVSGLRDERMMRTVSSAGVPVVIVHMHGTPATMREKTMSGDVIPQVSGFFDSVLMRTDAAGIKREKVILDPGIGFGKTYAQDIGIVGDLRPFGKGCPILTGTSMKSFLEHAYPDVPRHEASILSAKECVNNGAHIVRVHDVAGTVKAVRG